MEGTVSHFVSVAVKQRKRTSLEAIVVFTRLDIYLFAKLAC
jgi:hypothetical protein